MTYYCRVSLLSLALILLAVIWCLPTAGLANEKPAKAYVAIDGVSGQELLSESPDLQIYPASLTKMMTLYLLFDGLNTGQLKLGSPIYFSNNAERQPPSKLGVRAGQSITVRKAIYALSVKSANDVAVAVAERLAKTEKRFAIQMNKKARAIGMSRTNFVNASGLHNPAQITTTRDLAMLSRALLYKHQQYFKYFNAESFKHGRRMVFSHNNFLKQYEGADGIKTGYIRASGFNLAASAVKNGRRLIAIIVGGDTGVERDREMMNIMDSGFQLAGQLDNPRHAGIAPVSLDFQTGQPAVPPKRPGNFPPEQNIASPSYPPSIISEGDTDIGDNTVYAAQLGALSSQESAYTLAVSKLSDLAHVTAGGSVQVKPITLDNGKILYRARIAGLTGRQAQLACQVLRESGEDCLVIVQPMPG